MINLDELYTDAAPTGLQFLEMKLSGKDYRFYCQPMSIAIYNTFLQARSVSDIAPAVILKSIVNEDRSPVFASKEEILRLPTWLQTELFNYAIAWTMKVPEGYEIEKSLKLTGSKDSETDCS